MLVNLTKGRAGLNPLEFNTIAVSGQSNIVATRPNDTLTVAGAGNVTVTTNPTTKTLTITGTGGSGTVTSVSVTSANGFAGSVINPTTTPELTFTTTVTGLLKGNGTAISAAAAGTDYLAPISTPTNGNIVTTNGSGVYTLLFEEL